MKHMTGRFIALVFTTGVLAFGVAACGSDDDSSSESNGSSTTTSTEMSQDLLTWATDFTGGKAGAADESSEPFVVGFANVQGGVPSHPETTESIQTAAEFITNDLGGIAGRPVEIKTCFMKVEEDGQKCGAQFLADDSIDIVIVGVAEYGSGSLYKAVAGKIPVLVSTPAAEPDTTTPDVYTLSGGAVAPIGADGILATQVPGAEKSAVLHSDNPIGTFVATDLLKPALEAGGLEVSLVPVSDTATAPEIASAVQASGASEAQVFQLTTLPSACVSAAKALEQQNLNPTVITTIQCWQPEVYEAGDGKLPDGWIYTSYGDSPRVPSKENGRDTYVAAMDEAGMEESVTMSGDASMAFSTLMTVARMGNDLGQKLDRKALLEGIKSYKGPLMMTPGKPNCGKVSPIFIGVCTAMSARQQSVDGVLEALPPVNVEAILNPQG